MPCRRIDRWTHKQSSPHFLSPDQQLPLDNHAANRGSYAHGKKHNRFPVTWSLQPAMQANLQNPIAGTEQGPARSNPADNVLT